MNYRTVQVLAETNLGAAGTQLIDLNLTDPISRLDFNYNIAIGAGDRLAHISALFDKIEVIDGSDVLLSLSGTEMKGLEYLLHDEVTKEVSTIKQSTTDYGKISYQFGRYLWDEKLVFDPVRFTNPQIRLDWDVTTVEANATDSNVTVYAQVFDEKAPAPVGFLQTKELEAWTPAANEWEYVDLPRDYPYRALFAQTYGYGHGVATMVNHVKVSEDVDKRIPFDLPIHDLVAQNGRQFGVHTDYWGGAIGAVTRNGALVPCYDATVGSFSDDPSNINAFGTADGGHLAVTAGGAMIVRGDYQGLVPLGMLVLPVCDLETIEDFWNTQSLGNLQLQLQAGGAPPAGHNVNVVIQQLRKV